MTPILILIGLLSYFLMLLAVGYITGRKSNSSDYFIGSKQSVWWLVAIGMLSDSMSGVSFISVPGKVLTNHFHYLQVILGYVLGYLVIAYVLLPLYYKHNLTSIYSYLDQRFGQTAQKTGSLFFIISRLTGAAGRLLLTANVLQLYLFSQWNIPFALTVSIVILLILSYTIKGGIRTLVFTDALQSLFLIGGLLVCIVSMFPHISILNQMNAFNFVAHSEYADIFNGDWFSKSYFLKDILGGAFICIAMTGLDQNMMQKNLSCKSLKEAQKNMITTAAVIFFVNVLFLSLGIFMIEYLKEHKPDMLTGAPTDTFFPFIVLKMLGPMAGIAFVLGLSAATFSSADSVLTTLTTSSYIDLFGFDRNATLSGNQKDNRRKWLHMSFAVLLLLTILVLKEFKDKAIIDLILEMATYTYGPLLGLFALGIFTKHKPNGRGLLWVSLFAPLICWILVKYVLVGIEYKFGLELLLMNGFVSFGGYLLLPNRKNN